MVRYAPALAVGIISAIVIIFGWTLHHYMKKAVSLACRYRNQSSPTLPSSTLIKGRLPVSPISSFPKQASKQTIYAEETVRTIKLTNHRPTPSTLSRPITPSHLLQTWDLFIPIRKGFSRSGRRMRGCALASHISNHRKPSAKA